MNILIVDDTAMVRIMLERNLMTLGVPEEEIFQAENGEKGLERFTTFHCRAIITDMRMPVMDGLAFVKAVRKLDAKVPIIMLTSASERGDVVAAVESGVNDYLLKPFAAGDMGKKLLKMLSQMKEDSIAPDSRAATNHAIGGEPVEHASATASVPADPSG